MSERSSAVAIIGMAGRFPGAPDLDRFWANLRDGVESITFFGGDAAIADEESGHGSSRIVRARGVIDDADRFDAAFFGYTPREAATMDPQLRVFLECAHAALEDGGYSGDRYPGRIAVYAGASINTYFLNNICHNAQVLRDGMWAQIRFGNRIDTLASRASYKLNLRGAALTVQTNCSTSLVTVHLAGQALLAGECDMALAGGVAVHIPQHSPHLHQPGGVGSADGHCRAFDADGTGFVSGNGVGLVLLKRLDEAIADRDPIRAVMLASAVNNDGATKVGYGAPSVRGQAEVIAEALALAGVPPETLTYVEAHGTATPLGDPVEVTALISAFGDRAPRQSCALGSVKTNIGHLDTAAGIAGLIKTVLALEHRQIPPSLHFKRPNPGIDFASSPFFVNDRLRDWQTADMPRRAGVSSFGIGGTNAHLVLEEAPPPPDADPSRDHVCLAISARTEAALDRVAANLAAHLDAHHELSLADVAYTLHVGRTPHDHRRTIVGATLDDVLARLRVPGSSTRGRLAEAGVMFVFPGLASLYPAVGCDLYATEPAYHEHVDACAAAAATAGVDIVAAVTLGAHDRVECDLGTRSAQLFAVEYALARVLIAWGLTPRGLLGDDVGEYVAACVAGVFTPAAALRLLIAGARLTETSNGPTADSLRHALNAEARRITYDTPRIPFVSASTGRWIELAVAGDPAYWTDRSRTAGPLTAGAVRSALGECVPIECGPRRTHSSEGDASRSTRYAVLRHEHHAIHDRAHLLETIGALWCDGAPVSWERCYDGERRRRVPLPAYPFERARHWIEPDPAPASAGPIDAVDDPPRRDDDVARRRDDRSGPHADADALERLIEAQIQSMAQQLDAAGRALVDVDAATVSRAAR